VATPPYDHRSLIASPRALVDLTKTGRPKHARLEGAI
jgi:hypothetical protein